METKKKRTAGAASTTLSTETGDDDAQEAPAKRAKENTAAATERSPSPAPDFQNEYDGLTLTEESSSIDSVNIADLTPQAFYRDYVAKRKPCLIIGCLPDDQWKVSQKWTSFSYLKEKAGDV